MTPGVPPYRAPSGGSPDPGEPGDMRDSTASALAAHMSPLSRGELQDRAVRGAAWTLIHTFVSLPIAFVVNLVVARVLGPADFGRLALLTALMEIAGAVVALGLTPAMVQFGAKAHAAGRVDEVRYLLSASQGFRLLVVGPVLTGIVVAVAHVEPALLVLALVFGIWVPAAFDGALICLTLENKTAEGAKIAMATNVVLQAAVLAVVLTVGTSDAVWSVRLVMTGVTVALALIPIAPAYRAAVLRPRLPRGFPPGFWRFAIPTGIAGLVALLVVSRTEVFFLAWLATAPAVGIFALAFGLASHLFAPAQALVGPLIPAVSGLREVDAPSVRDAFTRTLRASATAVAVISAVALPPLAVLVPLLQGEAYREASPLLVALGVSGGLLVLAGPVSAFTLARLSARGMLMANLLALGVDVVLALALIPGLGAWGAVVANVSGAMSRLLLLLRDELAVMGMGWGVALRETAPVALGAVAAGLAWASSALVPDHIVVAALVSAGVGSVVLLAGLWGTRTGLNAGDAGAITRILPGRLATPGRFFLRALTARA